LSALGMSILTPLLLVGCGVSNGRDTSAVSGQEVIGTQSPAAADPSEPAEALQMVSVARTANPIDRDRAYGYLKQICDLGRRPTGSSGMTAQQELLERHFTALGGQVSYQRFQIKHPLNGQAVPVANIIVQWQPQAKQRILLCTHYDTRPLPDSDPDPVKRRQGVFVGANDGGSGTALLMELGHFMSELKGRYGVDFLLVDAEEFIFADARQERYFIGSEYFSRDYAKGNTPHRYVKAAVLDMIGDRDLQIYQDRNSIWWRDTLPVTREIWDTAKRVGVEEFIARTHPRMKTPIRDDHLMLHDLGKIPTCEIIDFDYPKFTTNQRDRNVFWHTEQDTPDKCSGDSLAKVGWVMLEWLQTAQ
jgi:hypothetical protein